MPKLKSLSLVDLSILNLDGLSGHLSLNSLSIDCSSLENVNALSTLSSLQTLSFGYHTYQLPDLHGLSALENVNCYSLDRDSIAHMPSIKTLTIHNYSIEYSADFLQGMNALTNLTIVGNGIIGAVQPDLGLSFGHFLPLHIWNSRICPFINIRIIPKLLQITEPKSLFSLQTKVAHPVTILFFPFL